MTWSAKLTLVVAVFGLCRIGEAIDPTKGAVVNRGLRVVKETLETTTWE